MEEKQRIQGFQEREQIEILKGKGKYVIQGNKVYYNTIIPEKKRKNANHAKNVNYAKSKKL